MEMRLRSHAPGCGLVNAATIVVSEIMNTPLRLALRFFVASAGLGLATSVGADPTAYVIEAEFLAALSTLGLHVTHEGFESPA
jgi:hypothetical protein